MLLKRTWQHVVDFNSPGWKVGTPAGNCAIAASPARPEHLFFAAQ